VFAEDHKDAFFVGDSVTGDVTVLAIRFSHGTPLFPLDLLNASLGRDR
jgi:hypothetical protein